MKNEEKIDFAYKLLLEVAENLALNYKENEEKELSYKSYGTICEISNLGLDIRVLSKLSKSKKPIEGRLIRHGRKL